MSKLDLEWLTVFDEIYQSSSVSRAAETLGIAQATASIALNKLRLHFNDKLFIRTSQGMLPTPYAKSIYPSLKDVVERLEQVRTSRAAFDPASSSRSFRICMTDLSEVVLLPLLANYLRRRAPGIHIEVETISADSRRRLEEGDVDLAVGFLPHLEAGFHERTLVEETFVCMAAKDHPRIQAKISKTAFLAEGHIVIHSSGTGHAVVERVMAQRKIQRNIVLRLPSTLGVARIVAGSELLVVVPRGAGDTFATQEQVKLLTPPVQLPSYAVKLHWHERFHADPGNVWLRRILVELLRAKRRGAVLA